MNYTLTEYGLVKALLANSLGVPTFYWADRCCVSSERYLRAIKADCYLRLLGLIRNYPHWIEWQVDALLNAEEPDQGNSESVGLSQTSISVILWVVALVFVSKKPIRAENILVRSALTF
ncbi:hypothetical protein [Actinomadura sp. 3N407]|uniref:hypothetical protein n=1 Tax=Actinomadura sp. 3N407 TaxID=3457423 RepID=UPI003FCDC229